MSLVSDYNKVNETGIDHPVFNQLFASEPKKPEEEKIDNNPQQWYHIITADPTQAKAVLNSRSGKSYIIQGPPGTGKSQTITNLVADFLARGKTILFVCEKRAALDVVYYRLQQNKLTELCCYIHDSQGDKKEFIKDLRTVYEDFLKNKMDLPSITLQRKLALDRLLENLKNLEQYHHTQKQSNLQAGIPIRRLIENLLHLKPHLPKMEGLGGMAIPAYKHWLQFGAAIQDLSTALQQSGAEPILAEHPFNNLGVQLVKADNPFMLMESLVQHSNNSILQLTEIISKNNIPAHHASHLTSIKNLVEDSVVLESLAQTHNLKLVNASNPEAAEFEHTYRQYKDLQQSYDHYLEKNKRWIHKFDSTELEAAIELAHKHEKSFFSFFNSTWRNLKKKIKQSYDFSSHAVKPAYSLLLQQLRDEYTEEEKLRGAKVNLQSKYKVDNIDATYMGIEVLRRKQGDAEIDYLLQHPSSNELVLQLSKLNNTLHQLELGLQQCLYGYQGKSLTQIKDELATIYANSEALKELLPALRRFAELPQFMQEFIRKLPLTPVQAEAAMANFTLQEAMRENLVFAGTNQKLLESYVAEIGTCYNDLLRLNSDFIRAQQREKFLRNYEISNTAASTLSPEQKQLKKIYSEGRKLLEHEMGKTMRYKSIREMASNDSGKVLKDIKPVWLMSPLSVSDSLPLDAGFFDVVIFDEASQITLEEGVPALFRAPQTIIVGDEKQMPPSNFFSAKAEDPEDLEIIDGESEDEILTADADSLLVQGARKLSSTMLSWHYRSRYESLISYSNHAFYNAGLLTVPDRSIQQRAKDILEVQQPEEGRQNAPTLLSGSISFHYLPNSIYEARSNISEAKYIAAMVQELLVKNTKDSIGIVAFSQEQQAVIEEAMSSLAERDPAFDELLEKALNRREDGQFTGLFIKNLENVQGDERDIIIMSVCYGHDANKKMLMNFGPINRKGGEKRLNVIFSRAKKHMAVVSSIRHHHITNDYNDGANYFKRFLQYAELVSTGNMQQARSILDSLVPSHQKLEQNKRELGTLSASIKKNLENKGYIVDEQIGQSSFKCSLGIKKSKDQLHYNLGLLIDEDDHYKNDDLVEEYYQRPSLLRTFGWRVINVYAKDWLEDENRVLLQIINAIEQKEEPEVNAISNPVEEASYPTTPDEEDNKLNTTLLYSADSEKFWELGQNGSQLSIRFGRAGTKGQVSIKTFASDDEANLAKEQLIKQQLDNGFKPA